MFDLICYDIKIGSLQAMLVSAGGVFGSSGWFEGWLLHWGSLGIRAVCICVLGISMISAAEKPE